MQEVKISIIGNSAVGKTSFVRKLLTNEIPEEHIATLGVEVFPVSKNNKIFNLWDCAGLEKFGGLRDGYWLKSDGAIIFSSSGNKEIAFWYKQISRFLPDNKIVLFNNGTSKYEELNTFLLEHPNLKYFECDIKNENPIGVFDFY